MSQRYPWACPGCGVGYSGLGPSCTQASPCKRPDERRGCVGLYCACEVRGHPSNLHGQHLEWPCLNATCDHCSWRGTMPQVPTGAPCPHCQGTGRVPTTPAKNIGGGVPGQGPPDSGGTQGGPGAQ